MPTPATIFERIRQEIERASERCDSALLDGFEALERCNDRLAHMMLENFGDRRHAAQWMTQCHRALNGRTAWQALIDGDEDALWKALYQRED